MDENQDTNKECQDEKEEDHSMNNEDADINDDITTHGDEDESILSECSCEKTGSQTTSENEINPVILQDRIKETGKLILQPY